MRKSKDQNENRARAWPDPDRQNDRQNFPPRHRLRDIAHVDDVTAGFAGLVVMIVMVMVVGMGVSMGVIMGVSVIGTMMMVRMIVPFARIVPALP